jgi:hypothetical protein
MHISDRNDKFPRENDSFNPGANQQPKILGKHASAAGQQSFEANLNREAAAFAA